MIEEQEDILFEHFHLDVDAGQEPVRVDKYMSTHLEKTSRSEERRVGKEC